MCTTCRPTVKKSTPSSGAPPAPAPTTLTLPSYWPGSDRLLVVVVVVVEVVVVVLQVFAVAVAAVVGGGGRGGGGGGGR